MRVEEKRRYVKYIYPFLILVITAVFVAGAGRMFEMLPSVNYFGLIAYGAISLIMLITLLVIQKIINIREVYLYLQGGFTFIYISLLISTADKVYVLPSDITDIAEDLFRLVGFGFITVGIIKWIKFDDEVKHRLVELASVDGLTNIMNRRIFDIEFRREFANAKRYGRSLSLISLDLDHFKKINDRYGHFLGDMVLKSFTREVSASLRAGDIFSRWGGDEFSIVLPQSDREGAMKVAEKIRALVHQITVKTDEGEIHFTVSLGVTEIRADEKDASEMIERADKALYEAKKEGRDRTVFI